MTSKVLFKRGVLFGIFRLINVCRRFEVDVLNVSFDYVFYVRVFITL